MRSPSLPDLRRAVGAAALAALAACGGEAADGPRARVVIPSGATFRAVADSLAGAGVVRSATLFRVYAKLGGHDRAVKPGTYVLPRGGSWSGVIDALTEGRGIVATLTVPEGFAISQMVPLMERALGTPPDSVAAAVRDTTLRRQLDLPTPTLEGYLFPSTYTFTPGTSARQAVAEMVREFERRWRPEWDTQLQALAMSRHDVVTLASIIEKEAQLPEERPVIAAVYHNRLKARMMLQADPTVQYARGQHTARVLYRDLDVDSPYNTYRNVGLPPGPIASPGTPSIEAALFPASVPYLYFVAHPDGHHEFRTTFAEHTQAIREIRQRADTARRGNASGGRAAPPGGRTTPGGKR
jgi:UPF0755 protein